MLKRILTAAVAASLAASTAARDRGPASDAQDLAGALQRKYEAIRDFSADFVHTYRGGVLRKEVSERGHLMVKKPGKMRWHYTAPEEKLFVSDGARMYSYLPQDKQVIVSSVPAGDVATTPVMFLAGKGHLVRDFSSSLVSGRPGARPDTQTVKLVPKSAQPDYDWLILEVDPITLGLRGLVTTDAQGGQSSFSFTNLKENTGLTDKEFTFKIPRGVDVVTEPTSR